jgi:hypothetical protein
MFYKYLELPYPCTFFYRSAFPIVSQAFFNLTAQDIRDLRNAPSGTLQTSWNSFRWNNAFFAPWANDIAYRLHASLHVRKQALTRNLGRRYIGGSVWPNALAKTALLVKPFADNHICATVPPSETE